MKGSPTSFSTSFLLHLAVSGCRQMVRNLRTPCSSTHGCSSQFPVLPSQISSSQFTSNLSRTRSWNQCPDDFSESKPAFVTVVPQHFVRRSPVSSHVERAVKPATVSHHPTEPRVILSDLRLGGMFYCTQQFSHCTLCTSHGTHGGMAVHWRTLQQSALPAPRLHFPEHESHRHFLISAQEAPSLPISSMRPKWPGRITPEAHLRLSHREQQPSPGSLGRSCSIWSVQDLQSARDSSKT